MESCSQCEGSNPFCSSLPEECRIKLCRAAHRVRYKKRNEQVCFFDFKRLFVIESGYALTSRSDIEDHQQGTDILEPGNLVGVVQLFNKEYIATINLLPVVPVTGCFVGIETIEQLVNEYPDFAIAIIKECTKRYGRIASKLGIHFYGTAKERLAFSFNRAKELGLENEITHEDLACLSGLSRVTVTKLKQSF